ncbi:Imm42 family immunity protein [Herbaspirillum sp. C9C3]|uniref:Imm42 family immunity protein n=1 Tax=Herbaspirillum sp. C9C3 TaxID=2735271 RepID=UPI001584DB45|nr:Imm42 family immunity protein [Herbaspirillum sp. C9C3]NUT61739.1 hypothetical protein [Herbaspirillum sp. C9C3]
MIIGDTATFAFWYDIHSESNGFCFGPFNIFVNGKTVLRSTEDSFTLNMIAADLDRSLDGQQTVAEVASDYDARELFVAAMESRGYFPATDPEFPSVWWRDDGGKMGQLTDLYIDIVDERRRSPPFGLELSMYSDIGDAGWHFFLFQSQGAEILIYSKDRGRSVFSSVLNHGKVEGVIRDYCKAMKQFFS